MGLLILNLKCFKYFNFIDLITIFLNVIIQDSTAKELNFIIRAKVYKVYYLMANITGKPNIKDILAVEYNFEKFVKEE